MSPLTTLSSVLFAGLGTPLFVIICALALISFAADGVDLTIIFIEMYRLADTPALTAIPLFAFAGFMLAESGAARRLVRGRTRAETGRSGMFRETGDSTQPPRRHG